MKKARFNLYPHPLRQKRGMVGYVAVFVAVALIFISLGIYTGALLYTNYNVAKLTMEKAMTSAVTDYLVSNELKDTHGILVTKEIRPRAISNLTKMGWTRQTEDTYALVNGSKTVFTVSDIIFSGDDKAVMMQGTVRIGMPFRFMGDLTFNAEVEAQSSLAFIERN